MNDGNEGVQVQGSVQATLAQPIMLRSSLGRTLNKHVECDRTAINQTLEPLNNAGWSLFCPPVIIGTHVDLFFEKIVDDEPAELPPAASTEPAPAEENSAASTEASPV